MKDNNAGSKMEKLKLDDDALEAVSGGTGGGDASGGVYVVKGNFNQKLYNNTKEGWGHYVVGAIPSGKYVYGVTKVDGWYCVPIQGNLQVILQVKTDWFKKGNTNYYAYMEPGTLQAE